MAIGENVQIINSFSMKNAKPLDDREFVESIEEMNNIPSYLKWIGMQVYVSDIHTRFKWNGTSYEVEHLGFCSGNGAPSEDQYSLGDIYLDKDTGDLYYKDFVDGNISWTVQANLKGPQGPEGGEGIRGAHGSYWYSGTGINGTNTDPQIYTGSGIDNAEYHDMYINTDTGNLYMCVLAGNPGTAQWVYTGTTLQGPQGPQGEKGDPGEKGQQGNEGVQGPQGVRGNTTLAGWSIYGTTEEGGKIFSDAEDIAEDDIIPQDLYINSYFGHVFRSTEEGKGNAVHWYRIGNIKGSSLYVTSLIDPDEDGEGYTFPTSDIEYANVGDYCINPLTGKMAKCMTEGDPSTAAWMFMGYIVTNQAIYDTHNHPIDSYIRGIACLQNKTLTVTQGDGTQSTVNIIINPYTGATETSSGVAGLVPVAAAGEQSKFLRADGTWAVVDSVTCDAELNETSENPVQNKIITAKLNELEKLVTQVKSVTDKYATMLNIIGNYK